MRLAIVIPTLDEERRLASTLARANGCADLVVVADGGSKDRTRAIAADMGATVVRATQGRGPQLNRGAAEAIDLQADLLLFLHADTQLPEGARPHLEAAAGSGAAGGGFLVRFDSERPLLRLGSRLANLRTRWLRLPLGDQAQFATREAFEAIGGFPPWPILEDLELVRRLRRRGPIAIVPARVRTDARRFLERGVLRTVSTNWLIWTLFALGASPHRLAHLYRHVR